MTNNCNFDQDRLVSVLYEDADDADTVEVRAHLAECEICRAELEELQGMREMVSEWPNVVNAPRIVYVNEAQGLFARMRQWGDDLASWGLVAALRPAVGALAVVLVFALSVAVLDLRVDDDGRVRLGFGGETPTATPTVADLPVDEGAAPISRDDFEQGLAQVVSYMEELVQTRGESDRQVLMAAIDSRMQEQGMAMSQQLRGVVDEAFTQVQGQHERDLGLVFSAVDELGVITGSELQRMNNILASLLQRDEEEN